MTVLASATTTILITFGVAILACGMGGAAIYATLGAGDRDTLRALLRHPLQSIFGKDAASQDEDD